MIGVRLTWKAGDHVRAQTKDGQPLREPLDPRPVGLGRVPVPAHALQHTVGTRLQRRVQMRRQIARRFDEEPGERVVDLRGFDAAEAEADSGDGGYERFRSEERRVGKEGRSRWSPYH